MQSSLNLLATAVTSLATADAALLTQLYAQLDPRTSHRLPVYQRSFAGRTVASLSTAVFGPLAPCFPLDLLYEVVGRYLHAQPPTDDCMVVALAGLPAFLLAPPSDGYKQLLASLIQLCLDRWHLLYGRDPDPHAPPSQVVAVFTMPRGAHDLAAAWQLCEAKDMATPATSLDHETLQTMPPTGVLTVKTSPLHLRSLAVAASLFTFARQLASTGDAVVALTSLSDEDLALVDTDKLQELLRSLAP